MMQSRAILNAIPDLVFLVNQTGHILETNPVARRLLGYEAKELEGSPVELLLPEWCAAKHAEHIKNFKPTEMRRAMLDRSDLYIKAKDKTLLPVLISITPVPAAEGMEYVVIARDLSNIRQSEEQRMRKLEIQNLKARFESLQTLMGGLAHDLNNNLMVLLGNTELLNKQADNDQTRAMLGQIRDAGERIELMIKNLSLYAGASGDDFDLIDIVELIEGLQSKFNQEFGNCVQLSLGKLPTDTRVYANRERLNVALSNILTNSIEARASEHSLIDIQVTVGRVDGEYLKQYFVLLEPGLKREYIEIVFKDSGPGFQEIDFSRFFDPFYSSKFLGRGLGLPAALGVLRHLGGSIGLARDANGGGKVSVLIPALKIRGELDTSSALEPETISSTRVQLQ